jgi:hypothetical protein
MKPASISTRLKMQIVQALSDDYDEGAIEAVLEAFPMFTRDEAVDLVEQVERQEDASLPAAPPDGQETDR